MSDRKPLIKEYANEDIVVLWQPRKCIHSAKCVLALPGVFDVERRPWIAVEAATSEEIVAAVEGCPSGALSWKPVEGADAVAETGVADAAGGSDRGAKAAEPAAESATRVQLLPDGPLLVHGEIELVGEDGATKSESSPTALCRCGASAAKPYCDGSHTRVGFKSGE